MTRPDPHLTPPRLRVMSMLRSAGTPLKAYEMIARFCEDGDRTHPPTVYRALEYLQKFGLVHRVASLNAYMLCDSETAHAHDAVALLICDRCGQVSEPEPIDMAQVRRLLDLSGFNLSGVSVEGRGLCAECQA